MKRKAPLPYQLTTYHLPLTSYYLHLITYQAPLTTYHLSFATYYLALTTYHLPPTTYHWPLTTYNLPLTTYHLHLLVYFGPPTVCLHRGSVIGSPRKQGAAWKADNGLRYIKNILEENGGHKEEVANNKELEDKGHKAHTINSLQKSLA